MSGNNSLAWRAVPWDEHTTSGKVSDEDRLIEALEAGPIPAANAIKQSGLSKATFYRVYDRLEKKCIATRNGSVYYLTTRCDDSFQNGGN